MTEAIEPFFELTQEAAVPDVLGVVAPRDTLVSVFQADTAAVRVIMPDGTTTFTVVVPRDVYKRGTAEAVEWAKPLLLAIAERSRRERQQSRRDGHDWRVNPHVSLTSNPPRQQLVCAKCGAKSSRVHPGASSVSHEPRDWERA